MKSTFKDITEFRNGYKPLLGAFIGAGCGLSSICFYTHGVFVAAISNDTHWSRGSVQTGISIMILMAIITAPTVGWLIDRYTARRVALVSFPLCGIRLACMSLVTVQIATYYIAWALMSILASGTLPITWTKVVNGWFDDFRGLALGLTLAGTGVAATVAPGYVVWLIQLFGWRQAYVALSLTVMVIALPAVYLLFKEPIDKSSDPTQAHRSVVNKEGLSVKQIFSGYRFWMIAISLLLVAASISGLITNLVPLLIDKGMTTTTAAKYAGVIGISVILGRLLAGFLLDHFWAPLVSAIFLSAPCIAALILARENPGHFWIVLSALTIGLAAGAELDLIAFLSSRYFGIKHYGIVYGGLYIFFSVGAGLAPATFGWAFDASGNYQSTLYIVSGMSVIGAALMLTLGRYPELDKEL